MGEVGVKVLVALDHSGGAACNAPAVHDQHHGCPKPLGQLRCRPVLRLAIPVPILSRFTHNAVTLTYGMFWAVTQSGYVMPKWLSQSSD